MMTSICNCVMGLSIQAAFNAALDIHISDIVLGCKSKLCNSICTYEFFPRSYTVIRSDRNVYGRGVFVATTDRMTSY